MALLLYIVTAAAVLGLTHRFVTALSRGAALFLFLLPFVFVGQALLTNRVYAPIDKTYLDIPLSQVKAQYGIGEPHNPVTADIFSQVIPWRHAVRESYARLEWPLWNPYMLSGDILAAAMTPAPYSPFTLLAVLLPAPMSCTFMAAITFLVAATTAFALARERACGERAAAATAAAYAMSTAIALYVLWSFGLSWALLPLVLIAARRIVRAPGSASWALLTIALVLVILAGHPESVLHIVFVGCLFGAAELVAVRRNVVRALSTAFAAGAVALLLCAVFLLPFLEAIPQTAEYALRDTWRGANRSAAGAEVMAALGKDLFPHLHLRRWVAPPLRGLQGETAATGSIALGLALFAAWRIRSRVTWFFAGLTVFSLMAYVRWGPVSAVMHSLPLFDIALNERFAFVAALSLALLAGLGLERILDGDGRAAAVTLLALLVVLVAGAWWFAQTFTLEAGPRDWGRHTLAAELGLLAAAVMLLATPLRRYAFVVVALLVAQRALTVSDVHHAFPQDAAYPELEILEPVRGIREPFRIAGVNWALTPNGSALYGLEDVRGYEAMTLRWYHDTYRLWSVPQPVFFNRIDRLDSPLLSMMNVRFAFAYTWTEVPDGWRLVAQQGDAVLLENDGVLPRVFVPRAVTLGLQSDVALDQMAELRDFRERAWITADVVPHERGNGPGTVSIRRARYGYELDVTMENDGWVVVSNSAWKGWRAYVDGRRVATQRANVAFLSVFVPRGSHHVRLRYLPQSFVAGRTITFVTLLGVVVFFWAARRRSG